ncbi:MAG: DUF1122 family protein [Candidatus Aminicenantales bacterium]
MTEKRPLKKTKDPRDTGASPLSGVSGKKIGPFTLILGEIKPLRRSGWRGFTAFLRSEAGVQCLDPVLKGIASSGGKDGIKPWMDLEYWEECVFPDENARRQTVYLQEKNLDRRLFRILGRAIPPGGHLMVSYEGEHKIHRLTREALSLRIPPSVTPLGFLLFEGGFPLIKDWYLSEGGFEGPRKLWAEKAPDKAWTRIFLERTKSEVRTYLKSPFRKEHAHTERSSRERAHALIQAMKASSIDLFSGF